MLREFIDGWRQGLHAIHLLLEVTLVVIGWFLPFILAVITVVMGVSIVTLIVAFLIKGLNHEH